MTFFNGTTHLLILDSPSTDTLIDDVREQVDIGRIKLHPVPGDVTGRHFRSEKSTQLVEVLQIALRVSANRTLRSLPFILSVFAALLRRGVFGG